ncbi:Asp-tRNA(Asn)/Glu-tRNA(Gln) amidotransferase subunit GatB [Lachnospiraceae bacterium MD329]|nr:Asp-tRNA(Asn)/Glu-tRNA(Gln) amidotransferase subunit GatB [Lachnospiraceae bacterium MD329]
MRYQPVIGLEIHAELLTDSKVFCTCKNEFGGNENTRVCPRCSGLPGTLPLINKGAVRLAAKAGFATDCTINNYSAFDRKNYFYPDLPKAYQITQFEYPICTDGHITVIGGKDIRINRIHIEEDAGKLVHDDYEGISMADYNRCGVPLIEIVTEPDFRTIEEVQDFVEQIALRLKYAGVCDARMEQGSMRVDVNISIMPAGSSEFGTRAEIKNLNSLKAIGRAIEYEIKRQSEILDNGGTVVQETRRYNDNHGDTKALRSKEEAHDYRYFPEPDIPPVLLSDEDIAEIKNSMPEMPQTRFNRYTQEYKLPYDDAKLIISSKEFSDFYDEAVKINPDYKQISNLMLVELNRNLNDSEKTISDVTFSPADLAELVKMSSDGIVSKNAAKDILKIMFTNGGKPQDIAKEHGFIMDNDTSGIEEIINKVLSENPESVESFKNGNQKIFGFLMGQVIRLAGNGANPKLAKDLLTEKLK